MGGAAEVDARRAERRCRRPGGPRRPRRSAPPSCSATAQLLEEHFEELSALVTRENGKTLRRGARRRAPRHRGGRVRLRHRASAPRAKRCRRSPSRSTRITTREPLGVCAGITPFNFPAMVPLWMFPLAIACGNTFVLKPSEKVPLTAVRLARALPGGRPAAPASSTSSTAGARSSTPSAPIRRSPPSASSAPPPSPGTSTPSAARHGKRVQAAGGAKNVLLVMPDAEPDPTLARDHGLRLRLRRASAAWPARS